jgi:hypothetical protein
VADGPESVFGHERKEVGASGSVRRGGVRSTEYRVRSTAY